MDKYSDIITKEQIDKLRSNISNWKKHLNENWEDAKDSFDKQRLEIKEWTTKAKAKLDDLSNKSAEEWHEVKEDIAHLREVASEAAKNTQQDVEAQRAKLKSKLESVQNKISTAIEHSKEDVDEFWHRAAEKLEESKRNFEMFRLHFHLAKMDSEDEFSKRRDQIAHRVSELESKIEQKWSSSSAKLSDIKDEISLAWNNIKNIVNE